MFIKSGLSFSQTITLLQKVPLSSTNNMKSFKLRPSAVAGLAIVILSLVAPNQSASISKNGDLHQRVQLLRQMSEELGLPQVNLNQDEVCLTDGCLDVAYSLLKAMNTSVNPCDDFFQFSCGRWIEDHPTSPSSPNINPMGLLKQEMSQKTQAILKKEQDPNDPKPLNQAREYYKACMDVEAIEATGLEPLHEVLGELGGWPILDPQGWNQSAFDFEEALSTLYLKTAKQFYGMSTIAQFYSFFDDKNTSRQIFILDQPTFLLAKEMLLDPDTFSVFIQAYENFIVDIARELGSTRSDSELHADAKAVIAFETKLANITPSNAERLDRERAYNPYTLPTFQQLTDEADPSREFSVDWRKFMNGVLSAAGLTVGENEDLVVMEPDYFQKLVPILKEELKGPAVANYIGFRTLLQLIGLTTQAMQDIEHKFVSTFDGSEPLPRESRCATVTMTAFGYAISNKYLEEEFDEQAKEDLNLMVVNLKEAFKGMIQGYDWMKEETKMAAMIKVNTVKPYMVYPDWVRNRTELEAYYEGIEVGAGLFQNELSYAKLFLSRMKSVREPSDPDDWPYNQFIYPAQVNAMYYAQMNGLIFMAGVLLPPFYRSDFPAHSNFGGIGSVIGHEIGHGFDETGSQYDEDGNLRNWWDNETRTEFKANAKCLADQYSGFCFPEIDMCIDGEMGSRENIGDNGGIRQSYWAYQRFVAENGEEKRLPGLESFSPNQLFFMAWSNIWCHSITNEALVNHLRSDTHSPGEYRTNGPLMNFDEFSKTYSCPAGSKMNPEHKCSVW